MYKRFVLDKRNLILRIVSLFFFQTLPYCHLRKWKPHPFNRNCCYFLNWKSNTSIECSLIFIYMWLISVLKILSYTCRFTRNIVPSFSIAACKTKTCLKTAVNMAICIQSQWWLNILTKEKFLKDNKMIHENVT